MLLSNEQLAKVQAIMQERGLSHKSAVQYLRRQEAKQAEAVPAVVLASAAATAPYIAEVVIEPPSTLPVVETPVVAEPALATPVTPALPASVSGTFSAEKAVERFNRGMKIVDIAVSFGYVRGTGQNRVRAALAKAGLN